MPLLAGDEDGKQGETSTKSVPVKAPEGDEEEMEDVPLDDGRGNGIGLKKKEKKASVGCILL